MHFVSDEENELFYIFIFPILSLISGPFLSEWKIPGSVALKQHEVLPKDKMNTLFGH